MRRTTVIATTTLALVVALGAPVPTAAAATITPRTVRVAAALESQQRILHQVAPKNSRTYGLNVLVGTDSSGASPVQVEMIGNVVYTEGSGPFFGTITFTAADGSTLGMRMDGRARALPNGTDATFKANLTVIGGTGEWLRARGTGRFTGSRKAALGSTVQAKFVVRLQKPR